MLFYFQLDSSLYRGVVELTVIIMFKIISILFLFISVLTMVKSGTIEFFNFPKNNLTKITWDHAVNDKTHLDKALQSEVDMIEADVQIGDLQDGISTNLPIMAHPPNNISDLSLNHFLTSVYNYNLNATTNKKGIKLDFKTLEAFDASIPIIKEKQIDFPLWLNADIMEGPGNPTSLPVNANAFLEKSKEFSNVTLSIGWTTDYNNNTLNETYTTEQIDQMLLLIKNTSQEISFPVRAVYAAESLKEMQKLIDNNKMRTLTVWSAETDNVNVENLRDMIFKIGLDKVYIDVPKILIDQLKLHNSAKSLNNIGLFSLVLCAFLLIGNIL